MVEALDQRWEGSRETISGPQGRRLQWGGGLQWDTLLVNMVLLPPSQLYRSDCVHVRVCVSVSNHSSSTPCFAILASGSDN